MTNGSPGLMATVGTFDGVHRGHRLLLDFLKTQAAERDLIPCVLLPIRHPRSVVESRPVTDMLTCFPQRVRMIEKMGVKVVPLGFDERMRCLTSGEFLRKIRDENGVKAFVVGYNNRFGSDRGSCFPDYCRAGATLGMEIVEAPQMPGVSSSLIRLALRNGDVGKAREMLGTPYLLSGHIVHGMGLGNKIGFATANLQPVSSSLLIPACGVYATYTIDYSAPDSRLLPSATNIGYRPTVDSSRARLSIETHIEGVEKPMYGHRVGVYFISRLREERKFSSVEALCRQLANDMSEASERLAEAQNDGQDIDINGFWPKQYDLPVNNL